MTDREKINNYLKSLERYLSRLDANDANEVLREIESHIFDVMEAKEMQGEAVDVQALLQGFGPPRVLASEYVDHILTGSPPPHGFKTIQKIKQGVSKGLWYSMAIFGYGIASLLALVAVLKVLFPEDIGVWSAEHGNSIVISFDQFIVSGSNEMLGWLLIPICVVLSLFIWILTTKVLRSLKNLINK